MIMNLKYLKFYEGWSDIDDLDDLIGNNFDQKIDNTRSTGVTEDDDDIDAFGHSEDGYHPRVVRDDSYGRFPTYGNTDDANDEDPNDGSWNWSSYVYKRPFKSKVEGEEY